jgi:hypothetical protein
MKKFNLMLSTGILFIGFSACNTAANTEAKESANSLNEYVDSVQNLPPVYTVENWTAIDNGYQERAMKAEKTIETLEAEDKAKAAAAKEKYAVLKDKYEKKLKENEMDLKAAATPAVADYRQILRNRLFGEGKIGSDMKFAFVTGDNILGVYKNFVNTVADNKKVYTREDWDEINVLYEALDTRKNMVEKDLATNDNLKIAGLKIKFASIMATHRGGKKVDENMDAKK